MSLNWAAIWEYAISGAIVSWPVFISGLWVSHRRAVRKLSQLTREQTGDVRMITGEQTATLLHRLDPGYYHYDQGKEGAGPAQGPAVPDRDPGAGGEAPGT